MEQTQTLIPDTHSFVKEMAEAGMPQPVAEAFVKNYTKYLLGNLATKQDIEGLRAATGKDIENLRAATQKDIELLRKDTAVQLAQLETNLTKAIQASQFKIIGALGGLITVFAAIIALAKLL